MFSAKSFRSWDERGWGSPEIAVQPVIGKSFLPQMNADKRESRKPLTTEDTKEHGGWKTERAEVYAKLG